MRDWNRRNWDVKTYGCLMKLRAIALGCVAAAGIVALLVLLLGPLAWWATPSKHLQGKDKTDARNGTRQVLLAAVGGTAALAGLVFTAQTFRVGRRGQLTDRYSKAIAQLASDKQTERLGGVYALEHIMSESARDHGAVVDMLAAFIRERRLLKVRVDGNGDRESATPADDVNSATETAEILDHVAADVQAALSVLGRRPRRPERHRVDLRHTDLTGADLEEAYFVNVSLEMSVLREANLARADLRGLMASHAVLQDANLCGARMQKSNLEGVIGHGASLCGAQLSDANLRYSGFTEADAEGANFERAGMDYAVFNNSIFNDCNMREVSFIGTKARRTSFVGGRLQKADLSKAQVQQSNFAGANLTGVKLNRASLEGAIFHDLGGSENVTAKGLTADQILGAFRDSVTVLPPDLRDLPSGLERTPLSRRNQA
ncbi:pentapeptide repeat-containing protein [Micromonospora chokoriensis]|uniref:pentapeptide repeat-containing protein n=1 Tax=Micromonospora chokoriensis TaxID=356851 RepID=UPI000A041625|nr:pentapeptide repeat-containing protein [Micromonospora chokoriensis]